MKERCPLRPRLLNLLLHFGSVAADTSSCLMQIKGGVVRSGNGLVSNLAAARHFAFIVNTSEHASGRSQSSGLGLLKFSHELKSPLQCGVPLSGLHMSPNQQCPHDCPFWVEDVYSQVGCVFRCVPAESCTKFDPNSTIVDRELRYCRQCSVEGCERCELESHQDACALCAMGYERTHEGKCRSRIHHLWVGLKVSVALILSFIFYYLVVLYRRPHVNPTALHDALQLRSRTKLHKGRDQSGHQHLWDLETHLWQDPDVAGRGTTLHFFFQLSLIMWAAWMALSWAMFVYFVDRDLYVLGTKSIVRPLDYCTVTAWGHEKQQRVMIYKLFFILVSYLTSFVSSIVYAIYQLRRFETMDIQTTSMMDFAAVCSGVHGLSGHERVEEVLRKYLQEVTGVEIVDVSVCWDFKTDKATDTWAHANKLVEENLKNHFSSIALTPTPSSADAPSSRTLSDFASSDMPFDWLDRLLLRFFLGEDLKPIPSVGSSESNSPFQVPIMPEVSRTCSPSRQKTLEVPLDASRSVRSLGRDDSRSVRSFGLSSHASSTLRREDIKDMLQNLTTRDAAFVVFHTEADRDKALERVGTLDDKQRSFRLGNVQRKIALGFCEVEPDSVNWTDAGGDFKGVCFRVTLGMLIIVLAIMFWAGICFLPYAVYMVSFSYAQGHTPDATSSFILVLLVVVGNQLIYFLCRRVAEWAGFETLSRQEAMYVASYTLACLFNVILDLALVAAISYYTMVANNVHTYDGRHVGELETWQEIFESYPMQRAIGHQLMMYAMGTFAVPYIMEPIFAIAIPYNLSVWLVRSHRELEKRNAEKMLEIFSPMDLGRYADCLLNVTLAVLMFWFPCGYLLPTFGVLVISHAYIYLYDHYRVLRCVPGFDFSSGGVEIVAQWLMAIPCGVMASAFAFKANACESTLFAALILPVEDLWMRTAWVFIAHCVVHWLLLAYFVPYMAMTKLPDRRLSKAYNTYKFAELARINPRTWFSMNPTHCLRSQFIYKHSPPCCLYVPGKSDLIRPNPTIGVHFNEASGVMCYKEDSEEHSKPQWF